ncbi:MAG: DUF554 domain-containing protein [Oscillospiraceae bacterium]|nr:DUF554 domain-containing protein [Oscillospiraceae bacterium]
MIATIINVITVVLGGTIGTLFGNKIRPEFSTSIMKVMGFITACIGIQSAAGTMNFLVVVLSLVIGTLIGMLLKLDDRINGAGDWAKSKLANTPLGKGPFGDAVVTCFMLFCIGSMTILGSIRAGLDHDYSILFTKSVMDFISATAFSSALGAGVIFSAIPLFIFQGALTLLAGAAEPILTPDVINEMSAVGGPIFLAMAFNIIGIGKEHFKVGDMLPGIFLPIAFVPLLKAVGLF